jgi:hypothetical protein
MDFKDILDKIEELDSNLKPFFSKNPIPMIKHPLVYSIFHQPQLNVFVNNQYKHKSEKLKSSINSMDYDSIIFLHERPYRLNAFVEFIHNDEKITDQQYWKLLSEIWIDSENIYQNKHYWKYLLNGKRKGKEFFMSSEDCKYFNNLPDIITIYRGYIPKKNKTGFSYTLDKEKAEWFANRFSNNGNIIEKTIRKKDAFAYLNGRGEQEIIMIK